jgi:concanavalin A-like lectin/glucanase superfamily protein
MASNARLRSSARLLSGPLLSITLLAVTACSGDGDPTPASNGGSSPTGGNNSSGSGGVATIGGNPSAGSGGVTPGGAGSSAGGGNAGTSGSSAGTGGISSAGTAGIGGISSAGTAGMAGSGGGGAGAGNCTGRALSLSANGTNSDPDTAYSRVETNLMTALPVGNTPRTVEFWAFIKSTDWVGDKNEIYYYGTSGSTATAFGMDFGTNTVMGMASNHATLNPFTDGGFNVDSTADLGVTSASDQWVHIAMTYDGTTLTTYVNGKSGITSTGNGTITALATGSSSLMIGCNPENKQCFNGLFDEFAIWNVARTAMQIKDNYNHPRVGNEAGLVGYWKFDDDVGSTTAKDSLMTAGHPGTLMAAMPAQLPTFVTPTTPLPLVCP